MLSSCGEKLIEKPDNLIPEKKMALILYDLAIIAAAKSSNSAILIENNIETMDYIYDKYDIDSVQFVKSNGYYASLPTVYEAIYTTVNTRLQEEKKKLEEAGKEKNKKAVSKTVKDGENKPSLRSEIEVKDSLP